MLGGLGGLGQSYYFREDPWTIKVCEIDWLLMFVSHLGDGAMKAYTLRKLN